MRIEVGDKWTTLSGLDPAAQIDIIANAPEPPFGAPINYLRTAAANLLYLEEEVQKRELLIEWRDPHNRLYEAKGIRFLARLRSQPPTDYDINWPFKHKPDPHQLHVFCYGRQLTNIALAPAALGTGKTKMALDIAADKFMRQEIDGVIVIAPNGVHRQWITKGVPEHLTEAIGKPELLIWSPTKSPRTLRRFYLDPRESYRKLRIVALNVEAFSSASGRAAKWIRALLKTGRWMLIIDESTRIKNGQRNRTKAIINLSVGAAVRMILTGTPVTKGLEDFYAQYKFLDEMIIGLTHWIAFRNHYCVAIPAYRGAAQGAKRIVGYKNVEELFRKIAPVTFMIPSSVLGLTEPWRDQRHVELTPEQRDVYTMLASKLVEDLRERRIETPQNTLTELLRLQQVLCGRYFQVTINEDEVETLVPVSIPSNRPGALWEVLEEHDGQAVIWSRFNTDIDDIAALLTRKERTFVTYDGRVSNVAERERRVDQFARGEVDYFDGNMAAGGTGIDGLQSQCSLGIYYSHSFNREHRWQSEGRLQRRGQKGNVGFLDMVCPGTVDELFLAATARTEELVRMVMNDPSMLTGGLNGI